MHTHRPDSVAGLEPGKAAIDATTIMAIRLGGAILDVLHANDGEVLKQYCIRSVKLLGEALAVRDSDQHDPIIFVDLTLSHQPARIWAYTRTTSNPHNRGLVGC